VEGWEGGVEGTEGVDRRKKNASRARVREREQDTASHFGGRPGRFCTWNKYTPSSHTSACKLMVTTSTDSSLPSPVPHLNPSPPPPSVPNPPPPPAASPPAQTSSPTFPLPLSLRLCTSAEPILVTPCLSATALRRMLAARFRACAAACCISCIRLGGRGASFGGLITCRVLRL